jgi:hypothetical protein
MENLKIITKEPIYTKMPFCLFIDQTLEAQAPPQLSHVGKPT